ncbi:MAG: DUF2817 domain-containing protein [Candidatus Aminicenantes bacterium]|nr:DUF2817 domain-containing protein [Candidatus Aminicenantes bacterium]
MRAGSYTRCRRGLILIGTAASALLVAFVLEAATIKTPAEECLYARYTLHEEVARFLGSLDFVSRELVVRVVGATKEVRGYPSRDLYLCILTETGVSSPEKLDRSRPTVLIIASQHGNEQSAKEAALGFIRDLAAGGLRPLLRRANFLVMPQCNPHGNHFDRRSNEQDLDMNRDHVKLESEGASAVHRVFRAWMPEATLDMHEKGDDYYRVSLGCVSNINIAPVIQEFSRRVILSEVERALAAKNIAFGEYLVRDEIGLNTSTGAAIPRERLRERETMLRYSTVEINDGRNSLGIYQTLSFIMECASRRDLQTLRERTSWQSLGLKYWAEAVVKNGDDILTPVNRLRREDLDRAGVYGEDDPIHLRMEYARDPAITKVVRKKFETPPAQPRGILKVDKKAGDALTAADLEPYRFSAGQRVLEEVVENWFPLVESRLTVPRPLGYVVPGDKTEALENLLRHGISVGLFTRDFSLPVEAYAVTEIEPSDIDWLPPKLIEVEKRNISVLARKGDFYVSCAQPAASLIPLLLEPQSQFGLICYRRFDLVPKKDELFAVWRVVEHAELPIVPYKDFLS